MQGGVKPWPGEPAEQFPLSSVSFWVPLAQVKWGWKAIAESADGGNHWDKTSGAHHHPDPDMVSTTEFPEWTDVVGEGNPPWVPDE